MSRTKKTALIFPGLGYHPDKPLLYYGKKLAARLGYDVIEIRYGGFAWGVKDNPEKMREAFESALAQTEEILKEKGFLVDPQDRDKESLGGRDEIEMDGRVSDTELLFISKSIGTAVAAAWQEKHGLPGHHLYFTPVAETFLFAQKESGIAFHGTADSWVDTKVVEENCRRLSIPLYITENADHSMETGDVEADLETMRGIMQECKRYIHQIS